MSPDKPTAGDRLKRGSAVTQPVAAQATSGPARIKPYRLTVDLTPSDYDLLRDWSHQARISQSDAVRALIRLVVADESVAQQVRSSVLQ